MSGVHVNLLSKARMLMFSLYSTLKSFIFKTKCLDPFRKYFFISLYTLMYKKLIKTTRGATYANKVNSIQC